MKAFEDRLIPLLQRLIAIKSPYFEEAEVMAFAAGWLKQHGLSPRIHHFTESKVTGFAGQNLICEVDSGRPGPVLLLNGHLDTVHLCDGWTREPFAGVIEGERLYGVGALDMKGGCAAMLTALAAFAARGKAFSGKAVLTLVCDEEGPYGLGTNALIEEKLLPEKVDVSIVAEPSAGFVGLPFPTLCLGARGGYGLKVELFGKAAHAANPGQGVSAATDMARVMLALEDTEFAADDKLGAGTSCVISASADGGACSVPDYARFDIFRHIVRGEDKATIAAEVDAAIKRAGIRSRCAVTFREAPSAGSEGFMPYTVTESDPQVAALRQTVAETTGQTPSDSYFQSIGDFCYLGTRIGAPCIIFGPEGENYHSADEYVSIPSLTATARVLYNHLIRMLEGAEN